MDIFYKTPPWDELLSSCLDAGPTPVDSIKHGDHLDRWLPYVDHGFAVKPQTAARHRMIALEIVAPVVIYQLKDVCIFNSNQVKEKVAGYFSSDTDCFNKHTQNTLIEDVIFEAIERIAVLCYALEQHRLLVQFGDSNAPQILVDTLNLEAPHLNYLSTRLPGFRQKLWSSKVSQACGEYIVDFADFQHQVLTRQEAKEQHVEVLDTEQLPEAVTLSR